VTAELRKLPKVSGPGFAADKIYLTQELAQVLTAAEQRAQQILELFNGRNAREVARAIGCGRATVYRVLKQHGGAKA
jgi:DNA invertase Pin-like site-specific DNA recombinase